jgi:predicted nucleotidyltransferase
MWTLESVGIDPRAMDRYIAEQIYTLPGVARPEEQFSIVLTGSRSVGAQTPESDVDLEVLCTHGWSRHVLGR